MYLPLAEPDNMPPQLRASWDIATPAGKRFIGLMANAPEHADRLFQYYNPVRYGTKLGMKLSELIRLTAIQDTQCAL